MIPKKTAQDWIDARQVQWSDWTSTIFGYGETAWREYRSAAFYIDLLRAEGFEVEAGSGGMPTAFCAVWENGSGPTIGGYAEYDAVPGNCQAADIVERPRENLSPHAGGHTDPHSALGIGSLIGFLAAKRAMQEHGIKGRLKFFGEPAEKVRGSKPIHAAAGYYDDLDAAISFHPFYMLPYCNTVRWDTHCGAAYAPIYTFECPDPAGWLADGSSGGPIPEYHSVARVPGANDAVMQMYMSAKTLKEHVLSSGMNWSMNETILTMGQATADNLPARLAQIQYMARVPTIAMGERVLRALDHFADSAARLAHCRWKRDWVAKSRPGLANHALAMLTYANLAAAGPPSWGAAAIAIAHDLQRAIGHPVTPRPFLADIEQLTLPEAAEARVRAILPPNQTHFTSDDYTEFCWHAPTVRLYIGRPALAVAPGQRPPPDWVMNALGGIPATIDPMTRTAGRTIAGTILDLATEPAYLAAAKTEFVARTGGGVGGKHWLAPLCDYPPPIHFKWPEYVTTARGVDDWVIPGAAQ